MNVDAKTISRIVGETYEAAYDPGKWPVIVERLRNVLHGSRAFLVRVGPDMGPSDSIAAIADPAFQSRASEFWDIAADFIKVASALPPGLVYNDNALHGQDRLRASQFWNEWMAPQEMYSGLACKLLVSQPSFWSLYVHRGRHQETLNSADVALFSFFVPHVRRAVEIGHALQTQSATSLVASRLRVGIALVDGFQRVVSMNEAAEAILTRAGSPVRIVNGHLAAKDLRGNEKLRQLIVDACILRDGIAAGPGGDLLMRGNRDVRDEHDILLSVGPAPHIESFGLPSARYAVIYVRDMTLALPDGFEDHVRVLFDLSPSEARIAAALASGIALKDAAMHQGIRFSTARSYLDSIFRKTGTRQQSQLVALLKSVQPLIR